jgi:SAM-dependent methyltransferase
MEPAPVRSEHRRSDSARNQASIDTDGTIDLRSGNDSVDAWLVSFGFSSLFDAYQCVVQRRDEVADDVQELLTEHSAGTVLDCAAGTGLPALDLRHRGVKIDCSDGDPEMVAQFQRNAKCLGVDDQCEVRCWSQIPTLDKRYDYVLCRGNSLVYAATWGGGSEVAPTAILRRHLASFRSALLPGGVLQVDVPRRLGLAPCDGAVENSPITRPWELEYEGPLRRIAVVEEVVEEPFSRRWRVEVEITPEGGAPVRVSFERHSSRLTVDDLVPLLAQAGFVGIEQRTLPSDRPSHITVLARSPT